MTTTTLSSLLVELGMDSAQFERASARAESVITKMARTIGVQGRDVVQASQRMGVSVTSFGNQVAALQSRLNPGAAALTKYRQEMNLLRESFRIGAISQEQFQAGVQQSVATYRAAGQQVNQATGQMRGGMQNLGFQLNDIATQFAMGTAPMTIFVQQSGQVIQAVQMMNGGTSKLGAFLMGPWGMALTIGAVALTPLIAKLWESDKAAKEAMKSYGEFLDKVAAGQMAEMIENENELRKAQEKRLRLQTELENTPIAGGGRFAVPGERRRLQDQIRALDADIRWRQDAANRGEASLKRMRAEERRTAGAGGGGGGGVGRVSGPTGPSQLDISRQFNEERRSLMQQYNSAMASMAMSAEQAADFELRNVELARIRTLDNIKFNDTYSVAQKEQLTAQAEEVAELERQRIERNRRMQVEREAEQIRQEEHATKVEGLRVQMSMADTDQQRLALALQLFDLERQEKEQALQRIIASETRTEAEKQLAQLALDNLRANAPAARALVGRQNETRAQAYMRDLQMTPEKINEAIDNIKINGLERLNDELVDALVNFKSLGDVAKSVIKQIIAELARLAIRKAIIGPLASALGLGGDAVKPIAGARAMGGPVRIGRSYLVGEQGPELFTPGSTGQIVPNHDLRSGGLALQVIPSPYFDVRVQENIGQAAPALASAGAQVAQSNMAWRQSRRVG